MGQGLILAKDITEEMKAEYVALIRDGLAVDEAARQLGSTGSQFKRLRNGGYWHDEEFAHQVAAALASEERKAGELERLEQAFWTKVEEGHWPAIEKGLYAKHPDWEKMRHSNLNVTGQIHHAVRMALPHLSDDAVDEAVAKLEEKRVVALLPPPAA